MLKAQHGVAFILHLNKPPDLAPAPASSTKLGSMKLWMSAGADLDVCAGKAVRQAPADVVVVDTELLQDRQPLQQLVNRASQVVVGKIEHLCQNHVTEVCKSSFQFAIQVTDQCSSTKLNDEQQTRPRECLSGRQ